MKSSALATWMTCLVCLLLTHCVLPQCATAQDGAKNLAKLGEQFITDKDVDFQLGRVAGESTAELPKLPTAILQSTIHLIAQQRQALQTMRTRNLALRRDDVERWLEENAQPPDGNRQSASEIVRKQSQRAEIPEAAFRDHLTFRLSWQRYLQQQLNEKNVAKHFENQTKRFDGTRFRISLLEVAVPAGKSPVRDTSTNKLSDLKSRLSEKSLSWKELASTIDLKNSEGLQAARVREKIWVRGTGDLDPALITAIMKLSPDEVSDPIHSPTGVHLMQMHEVEAGAKTLPEVRDEVRAHMLLYLLEHLAKSSEAQLPLQAIVD